VRERAGREARPATPEGGCAPPKLPHRLNNLTLVLLLQDKLTDADAINHEAWSLTRSRSDITTARILFMRLVLCVRQSVSPAPYLGQLNTLLTGPALTAKGNVATQWDIAKPLEFLGEKLTSDHLDLLTALVAALNDRANLPALDAFSEWRNQPPVPLATPWPRE